MIPLSSESEWLPILENLPEWRPPPLHTVIVSPHPDDESLGAGGLIASQRYNGVPVTVVAVTDGEAAYPDAPGLGQVRCGEQEAALAALGVAREDVIRLHLPDSGVESSADALATCIASIIRLGTASGILLVAPWSLDSHPDHEACGRVAEHAAHLAGVTLVSYMFWAWHRKRAESLAALPLFRFELDAPLQAARAAALSHHRSQLERKSGSPILPAALLAPAQRSFETFIIHA